jgi:type IV fimbrial biogenesis protein FimT
MQRKNAHGFTLIELLITMSILAVVLAFAVPSFERVLRGVRVDGEISNLLGTLQSARSEAVKRGVSVSVKAPSSWGGDIETFVDINSDLIIDASDTIIGKTRIGNRTSVGDVNASLVDGVIFSPTGSLGRTTSSPRPRGHIALKADDGLYWAVLCLNTTGRTHVIKINEPVASIASNPC